MFPKPYGDRGLRLHYEAKDGYGASLHITDSSSIAPTLWLRIEGGMVAGNKGSALLRPLAAIELGKALITAGRRIIDEQGSEAVTDDEDEDL